MHSTNYSDAFIAVSDDCPTATAQIPPKKKEPTAARLQFEMLSAQPYTLTSDDVLFAIYAQKNQIADADREASRDAFFSKGQPCMRTSPLAKRYGWGIHFDHEARVAVYPRDSPEYERLAADASLKQLKAMKSSR